MNPSSSGPTPLNPRGGAGGHEKNEVETEASETGAAPWQSRSESSISSEAQAVRTLASAHRLAGELENEARRRADEITAKADLDAAEQERQARARTEAMIAEAKAERDQIWEQIRVGVGRATRQVGDLLRIREELRLDLREALQESQHALERLEEGGSEAVDAPAPPAWLSSGTEPRKQAPAIPGRAAELPLAAPPPHTPSPLSPAGGVAPPAPHPAAFGPAADAPTTEAPAQSESLSTLRAGPFESFLAVMRFERELAALAPIEAVYVRRFSNQEVDVEVSSPARAQLPAAIGSMPAVVAVEAEGDALRVRVQPGETAPE